MMGRVPVEIKKFLERRGELLLIKGAPGTGKTTLALQLLKEIGTYNIFLSTRVSAEKLYEQFPWIKESILRDNVLNVSKEEFPLRDETAIRYRDENDFLGVLGRRIKEEGAMIVIDSWDTISLGIEDKETFGQSIANLAYETQSNIILTVEHAEPKELDYIVDGIVTLERSLFEERMLRELYIEKLRGVGIRQPRYLFTLEDAQFRYFKPFDPSLIRMKKRFEVIPDKDEFHFSSGIKDFDRLLLAGGYDRGNIVMFEIGENVPTFLLRYIIIKTAANFMLQGRHSFFFPDIGFNAERIRKYFLSFINEEDFVRGITIIEEVREDDLEDRAYVMRVSPTISFADVYARYKRHVELKEQPSFRYVGLDKFEHQLEEREIIEFLDKEIPSIKERRELLIVLAKPALRLTRNFSDVADKIFRVEEKDGCYILYGKKPRTCIYYIEISVDEWLKLTPLL